MKLAGIIALSDPPRTDSAAHITELRALGVRTVMVTGDAPATAAIVARAVGLEGAVRNTRGGSGLCIHLGLCQSPRVQAPQDRIERGHKSKMAEKLGLDRSYLADMERGKRNVALANLEVIALGFELTLSKLLSRV